MDPERSKDSQSEIQNPTKSPGQNFSDDDDNDGRYTTQPVYNSSNSDDDFFLPTDGNENLENSNFNLPEKNKKELYGDLTQSFGQLNTGNTPLRLNSSGQIEKGGPVTGQNISSSISNQQVQQNYANGKNLSVPYNNTFSSVPMNQLGSSSIIHQNQIGNPCQPVPKSSEYQTQNEADFAKTGQNIPHQQSTQNYAYGQNSGSPYTNSFISTQQQHLDQTTLFCHTQTGNPIQPPHKYDPIAYQNQSQLLADNMQINVPQIGSLSAAFQPEIIPNQLGYQHPTFTTTYASGYPPPFHYLGPQQPVRMHFNGPSISTIPQHFGQPPYVMSAVAAPSPSFAHTNIVSMHPISYGPYTTMEPRLSKVGIKSLSNSEENLDTKTSRKSALRIGRNFLKTLLDHIISLGHCIGMVASYTLNRKLF